MGGSNNLYISEMLEDFKKDMNETMGKLAANMENIATQMSSMSENMIENVNAISRLSSGNSSVAMKVNVKPPVNSNPDNKIVLLNSDYAFNSGSTSVTSGNTYEVLRYKCLAEGKVKVKARGRTTKSHSRNYCYTFSINGIKGTNPFYGDNVPQETEIICPVMPGEDLIISVIPNQTGSGHEGTIEYLEVQYDFNDILDNAAFL